LIRIENYAQWFEKSMSWIHSGGLKPMQASSWILGALTRAIWLFILDQEQMIVPWKEHRNVLYIANEFAKLFRSSGKSFVPLG